MRTRLIDIDSDHPVISQWWESHGFDVVPSVFLPKIGVMVESEAGERLAAGWVYMDNSSPVCWLEWVVTNPSNRPTVSMTALKTLVGAAKETIMGVRSELPGAVALLFTCRQQSLARLFEKEGFEKTDTSVMHMLTVVYKPETVGGKN